MIETRIIHSIEVKQRLLEDRVLLDRVLRVADLLIQTFRNQGKVLLCGNGGSAADAQHLAAEFSGRFLYDRPPLPAEALHVNSSYLTAVANDYSFDQVYARLIKANARKGDALIAISTSGDSPNILNAVQAANELGVHTIGMTGKSGGLMKDSCEILLNIPSTETPRIQETHILVGHIICEIVESTLFPK